MKTKVILVLLVVTASAASLSFSKRFPFVSLSPTLTISPNNSYVCGVNPVYPGDHLQFSSNYPQQASYSTTGPGTITSSGLYTPPTTLMGQTSVKITVKAKRQTAYSTVTLVMPLVVASASLPRGIVGQPYNVQLQATGGCE